MVVFLLFKHLLWMMKLIQMDIQGELLHKPPCDVIFCFQGIAGLENQRMGTLRATWKHTNN